MSAWPPRPTTRRERLPALPAAERPCMLTSDFSGTETLRTRGTSLGVKPCAASTRNGHAARMWVKESCAQVTPAQQVARQGKTLQGNYQTSREDRKTACSPAQRA